MEPDDRNWHIFTHFIRKTEAELRQYVQSYILSRPEWFTTVSSSYLKLSGISGEDYVDHLDVPGAPLDLLGMYVLARLYRFHFGLAFENGYWCTSKDKDIKKVLFVLVFRGGNKFTETCADGKLPEHLDSLIKNTEQGLMPSHNMDEKVFDWLENVDKKQQDVDSDIEFVGFEPASYIPRVELKGEIKKEPVKFKAKLKIKSEAIKHEKPVGFSAPKNRSIQATYKHAVQILLRAKKEIATLDDRQVDKQK